MNERIDKTDYPQFPWCSWAEDATEGAFVNTLRLEVMAAERKRDAALVALHGALEEFSGSWSMEDGA